MRPSTRIKVALRAAKRRRYGYAALRIVRRGLQRAIAEHERRTFGEKPYDSRAEADRIFRLYWSALQLLRLKWPALDLTDERAKP